MLRLSKKSTQKDSLLRQAARPQDHKRGMQRNPGKYNWSEIAKVLQRASKSQKLNNYGNMLENRETQVKRLKTKGIFEN